MSSCSVSRALVELAAEVTARGPSDLAFDGLRVLQHPGRFKQVLQGRGADVLPVTIDLWPALSCDARCPSCPYRRSGARYVADTQSELVLADAALVEATLREAAFAGVRSVIFTGGGEPTLHPLLERMAATARRIGLRWALFTNGIGLSRALAAKLLNLDPAFIRVSVDAGSVEAHVRTYGVRADAFAKVLSNVTSAAKTARTVGSRAFGMSFTLDWSTPGRELSLIKDRIEEIRTEAGSGLGLVAFRPRVTHYTRNGLAQHVAPAGAYEVLVDEIEGKIVRPLATSSGNLVRLDVKRGLFLHADKDDDDLAKRGALSAGWMTTIDHDGFGYLVAELAGTRDPRVLWGPCSAHEGFRLSWNSPARLAAYESICRGEVALPRIHRTSPVDAFLRAVQTIVGSPLQECEAEALLTQLKTASWYRSPNPDFV